MLIFIACLLGSAMFNGLCFFVSFHAMSKYEKSIKLSVAREKESVDEYKLQAIREMNALLATEKAKIEALRNKDEVDWSKWAGLKGGNDGKDN